MVAARSGSDDGTIRLWDTATGACAAVFQHRQGRVYALAVLEDGYLATGTFGRTIRLWDLANGACTAVFKGQQGGAQALAVLSDGGLASSSLDATIRLWNLANDACNAVLQGHQGWVRTLTGLGDGRLASASASDDNTIRPWDPALPNGAPSVLFVADAAITALVAHPTIPLLVAGDASGRLHWLEFPTAH